MKKAELVFIPSPGIGHLPSTIELANLLLERDKQFSITILVMRQGWENTIKLPSHANIRFIELPHAESPPIDLLPRSPEAYISKSIESHKTFVKDAIVNHVLPNSPKSIALVLDYCCTSMTVVADELGLPSYIFFTSNVAFLGFMLHLPDRHDHVGTEFEESESDSIIPGCINPVPSNVLPSLAFDKEGGYISFVDHGRRFKKTKGILVNTFLDLELHGIRSLSPYDFLPVYTVGPLINHKNHKTLQSNKTGQHGKMMKWLDDQPPSSVVFLCFGSMGCFRVPQLREIALALERSGHRFLWSVRVASEISNISLPSEIVDLKSTLPEWFLGRNKEKGFVCSRVPQVEVLAHKAVGAFVSHCGWNSILESLWFGVPIVTWPLYAEQQLNAFKMVKELGLSAELRMDYRLGSDTIVKADEIAKAVQCVMEEDSEVRKSVKDMSAKCRKALMPGGTFYASIGHWIETVLSSS